MLYLTLYSLLEQTLIHYCTAQYIYPANDFGNGYFCIIFAVKYAVHSCSLSVKRFCAWELSQIPARYLIISV